MLAPVTPSSLPAAESPLSFHHLPPCLRATPAGGMPRRPFLKLVALASSSLCAWPLLAHPFFTPYPMPTTRTRTIQAYTAAWNEVSAEKRRHLLLQCWTPTSRYEDPTVADAQGPEALLTIITGMHQQLPGVRMLLASALDTHHQVGRFHWLQQRPDGTTSEGTDFVEFNEAGLLVRVVGFFGKLDLSH